MISVRPYKQGDAFWINPMKDVFAPVDYLRSHTDKLAIFPGSFAHTVILDYKIIAIVGITIIWPGVAEVWSLLSEDIKKIPSYFHRGILKGLNFYQQNLKIKRYQASVKKDYLDGLRWIKALGFEYEGEMKSFGPDGSDFFLFGRVA